jgi:hypothetical protein
VVSEIKDMFIIINLLWVKGWVDRNMGGMMMIGLCCGGGSEGT